MAGPKPAKATLFVPVSGLGSHIDEKLLPVGGSLDLLNAFAHRWGLEANQVEAKKRFGTTALPTLAATPYALAQHKDALVALSANGPIEVLPTPTSTAWTKTEANGGPIAAPVMDKANVKLTEVAASSRSTGSMTVGDVAYGGGYYWTAYLDAQGVDINGVVRLHLTATDIATGHIVTDVVIGSAAATTWSAWRVAFVNGYAVLAHHRSDGVLYFTRVNATTLATSTLTSAGAITATTYNLSRFDMYVKDSTTVSCVFPNGATPIARCADYVPSTNTETLWAPKDSGGLDISFEIGGGWMVDYGGSGKIALVSSNLAAAGTILVHWDIPNSGATRTAVTTYSTTGNGGATEIAAHTWGPGATGEFVVAYSGAGGTTGTTTAFIACISRIGGVVTNGPTLYRSLSLRSKSFTYDGRFFVVGASGNQTDGTHFLVEIPTVQSSTPLSTAAYQAIFAVRMGKGAMFSGVASPDGATFTVALSYTIRFAAGGNTSQEGIQLATITFPSVPDLTTGPPREAIDSLFVPGGQLRAFDGVRYAEAGFSNRPEIVSIVPGGGGSLTPASTYYYQVVYAYLDNQGRTWRSAPSDIMSQALGANSSFTVTVRPLRVTGLKNVQIELYRGQPGNSTTLQKVAVAANNITVDTVAIQDTMSDANAALGEILYTTGNVKRNDVPPGFTSLVVAQNRMWGVSADDPQAVWYTKEFTLDGGLAWSEAFVVDVRDENGPIRSLSKIGDNVIVFKDNATYAIVGQGPNVLGQGGTYETKILAPGVGCSNPMAVCEYQEGIIFRPNAQRVGPYQLTPGLSMSYVGAGVQSYFDAPTGYGVNNNSTVNAATFVTSLQQARFYTQGGDTLVYDIVNKQWSVFTPQDNYCATSWNGNPVYLYPETTARYENVASPVYTDAAGAYQMRVGWPWVQLGGIRGFQRLLRIQPVGEKPGADQILRVYAYHDFVTASTVFDKAVVIDTDVLAVEVRHSKRLSALKVIAEDLTTTDAGFKLSGYSIEYQVKKGLKRDVARMANPPGPDDVVLWLEADYGLIEPADGAAQDDWADRSANHYDMEQIIGGTSPLWIAVSPINGRPALLSGPDMPGGGNTSLRNLSAQPFAVGEARVIYAVLRPTSQEFSCWGGGGGVIGFGVNANPRGFDCLFGVELCGDPLQNEEWVQNNGHYSSTGSPCYTSTPTNYLDTNVLAVWQFDGSILRFYINGVERPLDDNTPGTDDGGAGIVVFNDAHQTVSAFTGYVAAILAIRGAVISTYWTTYLAAKYGISLP